MHAEKSGSTSHVVHMASFAWHRSLPEARLSEADAWELGAHFVTMFRPSVEVAISISSGKGRYAIEQQFVAGVVVVFERVKPTLLKSILAVAEPHRV